ncbi:hypothetical protein D9C73_016543 [Collichthys lucidus]|uniref:Uncharacterized protein n=1 Tax=Collichthys lucidus TaxID=240159 RepID=A0A4U5V3M6_COLLU|nr:hypothetical protein D9C73_016543 [Collichthys lucidus]
MTGVEIQNLVQTGFVLIFQCINYKNIRLHYTFAILLSNWSVAIPPRRKSPFFVSCLVNFHSATWLNRRNPLSLWKEGVPSAWHSNLKRNLRRWRRKSPLQKGHPKQRRPKELKMGTPRPRSQRPKLLKPNE